MSTPCPPFPFKVEDGGELPEAWRHGLDEALADVAAGRMTIAYTAGGFLAQLDQEGREPETRTA